MNQTAIKEPNMHNMASSSSSSLQLWRYEEAHESSASPDWLNEGAPKSSAISEMSEAPELDRVILQEPSGTQKLHHYLTAAIQAKDLEAKTASVAMRAWRALSDASLNLLPLPDTGVGLDGQILYTWNKNKYHFELEIFPDGHGEFFYLNLLTDETWSYEHTMGNPIPAETKEKLELVY